MAALDLSGIGVALIRVMLIAQKPAQPPPQPHPIGQQALRQQRLQLFNTGISHAGARIIAGRDTAGKPKTDGGKPFRAIPKGLYHAAQQPC